MLFRSRCRSQTVGLHLHSLPQGMEGVCLQPVYPFGSGARAALTIHSNPCRLYEAEQQGDTDLVYFSSFRHLFFQRIKDADDTFQFFFVTERDTDFTFAFLGAGQLHFGAEEAGKLLLQHVELFG